MIKVKWNLFECVCVHGGARVTVCLCEGEEGERGKIQTEV